MTEIRDWGPALAMWREQNRRGWDQADAIAFGAGWEAAIADVGSGRTHPAVSFIDPAATAHERRKMQLIYLLQSLKTEIDIRRGMQITRSEWIERAIQMRLEIEKARS